MNIRFQGRNLRKGRVSIGGQIYAITAVSRNRLPLFSDFRLARMLTHVLHEHESYQRAQTLAFVIMPDHLHWMMKLENGHDLSYVVRSVKAISSRRAGIKLWQKGFYDYALRRDDDMVRLARYIIANPLRAGLVESIGDYPHWDAIWL